MFVTLADARIYVEQVGEGAPALLLHGVPDTADLWQPVMDGISAHYQCFAPDLPGFYRSEVPKGFRFTLDGYADFVNDLLDGLGIEQSVTLVLHDWGGIFGMAFAAKYPARVAHIVGGSFPFSHLYRWHFWARVWQLPGLGELAMLLMNRMMFERELTRGSRNLPISYIREAYDGKASNMAMRRMVLKLYRSLQPRLFIEWHSRVQALARDVRIDLIWGKQDPFIPGYIGELIPHNSMRFIDECGHWVPREEPSAYIAALVDQSRAQPLSVVSPAG